jgi:hypothetical protein
MIDTDPVEGGLLRQKGTSFYGLLKVHDTVSSFYPVRSTIRPVADVVPWTGAGHGGQPPRLALR